MGEVIRDLMEFQGMTKEEFIAQWPNSATFYDLLVHKELRINDRIKFALAKMFHLPPPVWWRIYSNRHKYLKRKADRRARGFTIEGKEINP